MPSLQERRKALQKILQSKEFAKSELSKRLLEYLVDAADRDPPPKETTIAIDVFGRQEDYDPSTDAYVRSVIYKLRRKLERYYQHEGKNDRLRIIIPKGQYHVEFRRNRAEQRSNQLLTQIRRWKKASFALAVLASLILLFHFVRPLLRSSPTHELASSPVWNTLFDSPKPVLVVVGDVFMFLEYRNALDSWRLVADPYVIDDRDFARYKKRFPGEEVYHTSFSMLPLSTVETMSAIIPFLHDNSKPFSVKLASRVQWNDINNFSIIYLGGTSGLHLLRHLTTLTHFRFRPVNRYFIIDAKRDTVLRLSYKDPGTMSEVYRDEYAYVAKIPGPENNVVYLFFGMDYNSRVSSVRKMLDGSFLQELKGLAEERFGQFPRYFEVLWKVGGYKEAAYKHEIIYFNKLESSPRPEQ